MSTQTELRDAIDGGTGDGGQHASHTSQRIPGGATWNEENIAVCQQYVGSFVSQDFFKRNWQLLPSRIDLSYELRMVQRGSLVRSLRQSNSLHHSESIIVLNEKPSRL